jgi:DNA-directed RNA polymerase specialized sigma24 family protein
MDWPPDDELLDAWRRLVADPTDGGAFMTLAVRPLAGNLAAWRPATDPHLIESAAVDGLLAFLRRPEAYDPSRLPLPAYLRHIARCRLINELKREGKHQSGRIPWDGVELRLSDRNDPEDDDRPTLDSPAFRAVIAGFSDTDRRVFDLITDGEKDTPVFAEAMGVTALPPDEQEREVKRAKDRVKARLKRARGGGDG